MKNFSLKALLADEENQVKGFTYIFDCSNLTLAQLSIWSPSEVRKAFTICEKNMPMKHMDINLLMLPFPMRAVFEFCKTLLSEKIKRRFSVHSTLDRLGGKLGSADILPLEYGGTVPLSDMAAMWVQELRRKREVLLGQSTIFKFFKPRV